jgi:DNA-binding NarL/FixJ family response regulator
MDTSPLLDVGETQGLAKRRWRILVIDDDASVGAAIRAILDRCQCETVLASRAYAGIHMLRLSRFDAVIIDIFMPGLSGLNAIEYIRHESSIPIIAMSGFRLRNSPEAVDHLGIAARRGATLCIRKPFKPSQLIEAVESSIGLRGSIERINTLTQMDNTSVPHASPEADGHGDLPDDFEIGSASAARSRVASEVGAAMAHQLNGPMTALLLYLGEIQQSTDRSVDESLKAVIDSAYLEAERICALIHKMGDLFEVSIPEDAAINVARDAIAWWSQAGQSDEARSNAGDQTISDDGHSGHKPLTPREEEVLRLVSRGHSNKEGAALMKISHRTFECHRAEVMRKLGARNAAELVRRVMLNETSVAQPTA